MQIEVKVPEVGESITEGVIVEWFKAEGAMVAKDEPLFELETDKITMQVPSPDAGRLSIVVHSGEVTVGQLVGHIESDASASVESTSVAPESTSVESTSVAPESTSVAPESTSVAPGSTSVAPESTSVAPESTSVAPESTSVLSPAVRRMVEEHAIDPTQVDGTGKGGRITKGDVVDLLERREAAAAVTDTRAVATVALKTAPASPPPAGQRETRKPMSSLRRRLAQRLVDVQQTAAILTTFNEVDMSAVIEMRERFKARFAEVHGVKLGFMSFFVKAVVEALQTVPAVNARIEGDEIVQNHYYDIGVAVGTDKGLVVPVLRDADQLTLAGIEGRIADLGKRARERRLELSELTGGVFTISNGGVYGSLVSTPIINPPQSAILGMHAIKKRPVVVGPDDQIVARPMMYLALSYDHRLIDGQEAVTFLKRIVTVLEEPGHILMIN